MSGRSPDLSICDAGACAVLQMHILSGVVPREQAKKTGRAARNVSQIRLRSLIHNSVMQRRPPSVTAASFKYGQKFRKYSGRNVMNANGFKKFEHDRPYGRYGFRQNLPVCIQHHGSGIPPPARLSQPETTRHKQVSLIITNSHQVSGRKTKHGLPPVNGNSEEIFTG